MHTSAHQERLSLAVIIPTRNRRDDLALAVRTLLAQTVLPDELIIVDQSPTDDAERAVRELYASASTAVRGGCALRYTRDPAITGAATARNAGMDVTTCDVLLFLDDDVELELDFVARLLETYVREPGVAGVSGIVTNYAPEGLFGELWHGIFFTGPFRDDRRNVYLRAGRLREGGVVTVSRFGGGLMSFRSASIGGLRFDANLRGACEGEDVDFCMRLPAGSRLVVNPAARLVHHSSRVARADEHWCGGVVRGNTYLYHRNWRRGLLPRLAYWWLMAGFAALTALTSLKQRSAVPWRTFRRAMRQGRDIAG